MSQKVSFIVTALGKDVDPFTLHVYAALAEPERRMRRLMRELARQEEEVAAGSAYLFRPATPTVWA